MSSSVSELGTSISEADTDGTLTCADEESPAHEDMFGLILLVLLLVLGLLAIVVGVDSRIDEIGRHRRHDG